MYKNLIAIIILIIALSLSANFLISMFKSIFQPQKRAPYIGTFNKQFKLLKSLDIKDNDTIIDLGCGDGKALRFFVKHYKIQKAIGYDINPYAIVWGKILNKIKGYHNISIYHQNFLNTDIKGYNHIYIYLGTKQLIEIEDWIWKQKDPHTTIISNSFKFTKHKPYQTIKNHKGKKSIFLYR